MVINWYGEGCFKVQTGGQTLLVDPFSNTTGLTPPRFKSDVTLYTRTPLPLGIELDGEGVIRGPGEYEVKEIGVHGYIAEALPEEVRSAYLVKTEELSLAFLGHIAKEPSPELIEHLSGADILFVPVGGAPYLDGETAAKIVKQLAPKIVVPAFFKIPNLSRKAESVASFLKEFGQEAEPQEKLVIKKKELPASTRAFVLSA
jgi:L-ascorbate metabolism protein UlaG (beta-lactamase superfamily)